MDAPKIPLVQMRRITKRFGTVAVLQDAMLGMHAGEVQRRSIAAK